MGKKSIVNKSISLSHEEALDFHLRSGWLGVSRMYNEIAEFHGLTVSMAFILINIPKSGANPTKLGPKMGMQANSLSRILKTLEEKNFIVRRREKGDKREVLIFLTEEGVQARKTANAIIADFNEILYAKTTPQQRESFFQTMALIQQSIREMREQLGLAPE
jgi:DNA-binding MarR family transcriptional regulator